MGICGFMLAALVAANPVSNPDWVRKPTPEQVEHAYPPLALMLKVPGRALLSCSITAEGKTRSCAVVSETPRGMGFGPAALSLVPTFEVKPLTVAGLPVDGGVIAIPLRFTLPEDDPPPTAKPKPSAEGIALARKILAVAGAEQQTTDGFNRAISALQARQDPWVDPDIKAKAVQAYRETVKEMTAEMLDASAGTYARSFTTAQLADLLAFYASPTGQVFIKQQSQLAAESWEASQNFEDAFSHRLHAKFCRTTACGPIPPVQP